MGGNGCNTSLFCKGKNPCQAMWNIDFLILLIPTPLVSVLFYSSIPTFCSFNFFFIYIAKIKAIEQTILILVAVMWPLAIILLYCYYCLLLLSPEALLLYLIYPLIISLVTQ